MRLYIVLLLFLPVFSLSQVVNIEKKRSAAGEGKLQGKVDLSLNFTKSSSDIFQAQNNIQIQYHHGRSLFLLLNDIGFLQAASDDLINNGFQHLRYNYHFKDSFPVGELFVQNQYNAIKKLKQRVLFGGGPRFPVFNNDSLRFFLGPLVMYEYEQFTDDSYDEAVRMSMYLVLRMKLAKILSINHTTYYQPEIREFGDYKVSTESYLEIFITEKLSFKLVYNMTYDSEPPEEVDDMYYTLRNTFSYRF